MTETSADVTLDSGAAPDGPPAVARAVGDPVPAPEVARALLVLADRMSDLEDAVAEAVEELGKVRKAIAELRASSATRKQLKKMKKILDQLEVIEVGPDDAPVPDAGKEQ